MPPAPRARMWVGRVSRATSRDCSSGSSIETTTTPRSTGTHRLPSRSGASSRCWTPTSEISGSLATTTRAAVTPASTRYTAGTTWTMNPTTVFDATFGVSRMDQKVTGGDFGLGNFGRDTLGIPGTNGGRLYGDDPRYAGLPSFVTGFSTLGNDDGWNPVERHERTYAFGGNVTKLRGAHEFRVGYSVNRLALDHWQPELGAGPRGALTFNPNATALNGGAAGNLYNAYAAFLLGLVGSPAGAQVINTGESVQYRGDDGPRMAAWVVRARSVAGRQQDDARSRAAVPGLPPDDSRQSGHRDRRSRHARGAVGGLGDNPKDLGIKVSKTLFAPRLGMIYRLDDNSVFRTGYGRTFNPLPFSRPLRGFYPLTISGSFVPIQQYGWNTTLVGGDPRYRRSGSEPGTHSAAEQLRHALPRKRCDSQSH